MRSHAVRILYYDLSLVFCNIFESFLLFWYFMDSPSKAFFQDFVKWVRSGTGLSYMYVGLSNCWLCRYAFKLYLFCILSRDLKKKKTKNKSPLRWIKFKMFIKILIYSPAVNLLFLFSILCFLTFNPSSSLGSVSLAFSFLPFVSTFTLSFTL